MSKIFRTFAALEKAQREYNRKKSEDDYEKTNTCPLDDVLICCLYAYRQRVSI